MSADNILKSSLKEFGIDLSSNQVILIKKYLDMVYEYNKTTNLIGTKKKEDILIRHFLDSISILKYKKDIFDSKGNTEKILDVGTGAGLPGMLLSILLNNRLFYLLDKNGKKIEFINLITRQLKLENVRILKGRAEELARESLHREKFDIVLSRAVARFNILCELIIPFCRINGKIIFYKSIKIFDEIKESIKAIQRLGGKVESLREVKVPHLKEFRAFLIIKKIKKTPDQYPRKLKKIKSKPLK